MRLLCLDIEVSPAVVFTWDLRIPGGYIPPDRIIEPKRMLCFAGKFAGENDIYFFSEWDDGHEEMVRQAWDLLDQADAALHYNGLGFDIPWLNTEFALLGLTPPSPYANVDLLKTVKKNFAFLSSSLNSVSKALGTTQKTQNEGFSLWRRVLDGDALACRQMEDYCTGDVLAAEDLYRRLLPWVPDHPSYSLLTGDFCCPQCGSASVEPSGFAYTAISKFQRWKCTGCGTWSRDAHRLGGTALRRTTS